MSVTASEDPFLAARAAMVADIERQVRAAHSERPLGMRLGIARLDPAIAEAMRQVPRHRFVPEAMQAHAYADRPLPIGLGQTISQPFIVAISTQLLDVGPGDRVYELGTGSGYQAAILAALGVEVYSKEIVAELAARAEATLQALGETRVHVRAGDGYLGWPEAAPFDAIVVTAAGSEIPPALIAQLKPGGRLVMPVGDADGIQSLTRLTKSSDDQLRTEALLPVRFVPITGPHGR